MLKHQNVLLKGHRCECKVPKEGDIISSRGTKLQKSCLSPKRCKASSKVMPHQESHIPSSTRCQLIIQMPSRLKQTSHHPLHVQHPSLQVWCHHGKGSKTSQKRCTILIKGNVIQPNPNILKGCNVQGGGFMPSEWHVKLYMQRPNSSVQRLRTRRCRRVSRNKPSHHMTQCSSSRVQWPPYSVQHPPWNVREASKRPPKDHLKGYIIIKQGLKESSKTNHHGYKSH